MNEPIISSDMAKAQDAFKMNTELDPDQLRAILSNEFSSLWRCAKRGDTLEICTPYAMPDSSLLMLYCTQRNGRFIATENGRVLEFARERSDLTEDEALAWLRAFAESQWVKEGSNDGSPIFFKECSEEKLIGSIAFDVINFAATAISAIHANCIIENFLIAKGRARL